MPAPTPSDSNAFNTTPRLQAAYAPGSYVCGPFNNSNRVAKTYLLVLALTFRTGKTVPGLTGSVNMDKVKASNLFSVPRSF